MRDKYHLLILWPLSSDNRNYKFLYSIGMSQYHLFPIGFLSVCCAESNLDLEEGKLHVYLPTVSLHLFCSPYHILRPQPFSVYLLSPSGVLSFSSPLEFCTHLLL